MTHKNNHTKTKGIYQAIVSRNTQMLEYAEVTSKKLKKSLSLIFNKDGNKQD